MALSPAETAFLESQHSAAMITIGDGGVPKAVRVGVALVDGRLWIYDFDVHRSYGLS